MLQRNNGESVVNYAASDSPEQGGLGDLVDFALGILRRQYVIISFFMLMAAGAGAIYLYVTPRPTPLPRR
jgi:hypothetical protein